MFLHLLSSLWLILSGLTCHKFSRFVLEEAGEASQTSVSLYIQLPYRAQHNNWSVGFSSYDGSYGFSTTSSTNPSNSLYLLGTIPEGTYEVTFVNSDSRDAQFEYWVGCNEAWVQGPGGSHEKTIYNVTIAEGCNTIYIDANY